MKSPGAWVLMCLGTGLTIWVSVGIGVLVLTLGFAILAGAVREARRLERLGKSADRFAQGYDESVVPKSNTVPNGGSPFFGMYGRK